MADFTPQQISEILAEFFDVVGTRQYIGARYVPIFGRKNENSIDWDNSDAYEPLTVVMYNGDSYTSRQYVPAGVDISNTDYWVITGRYNAQVEQYRQDVVAAQHDIEANAQAIANEISNRKNADTQVEQTLRDEFDDSFIPWPDGYTWPKFGVLNQVLATLANGDVKWVDPLIPTDAQAETYISQWLNNHPEATTTVEDGAVTNAKLAVNALQKNKMREGEFMTWGGFLTHPYSGQLTSCDMFPANTIYALSNYITEQEISDLPVYGSSLRVLTLGSIHNNTMAASGGQIAITSGNEFFFRFGSGYRDATTGKYTYGDWLKLLTSVDESNLSNDIIDDYVHSGHTLINNNSGTTESPVNLNEMPANSIWYVSANLDPTKILNLPITPNPYGILISMSMQGKTTVAGTCQIYAGNGNLWYRICHGDSSNLIWDNWIPVTQIAKTNIYANQIMTWGGNLTVSEPLFTSADEFPPNTTYLVNQQITSAIIADLPAYGLSQRITTYAGLYTSANGINAAYQTCVATFDATTNPRFFIRWATGFRNSTTNKFSYGLWREVAYSDQIIEPDTSFRTNGATASIFRKVVCCGDSYTSGYTRLSSDVPASRFNLEFAWPYYMSLLTGQHWINCGHSGTTALTWQTKQYGLPKAQNSGLSQAYVIGLMINDTSYLPLGTPTDIGTNNETYYAQYSKIIRELHDISPRAHIFVQTCPRTSQTFLDYNQAVRTIAAQYANTYNVHLLDLYEYRSLYNISSITDDSLQGHYTASGYQQFAQILMRVMSDYINSHASQFYDLYDIPYTINAGEI